MSTAIAKGGHLFDLALAAGIDSGRYILFVNHAHPDLTAVAHGPHYEDPRPDGPLGWMQEHIDKRLARQ